MKQYVFRQFHRLRRSRNHILRRSVGTLLVIGGILGFLPVLGFWMLPLGLALLAVDSPIARRLHRRIVLWWGRRFQNPSRARLRRLRRLPPIIFPGAGAGNPDKHNDP